MLYTAVVGADASIGPYKQVKNSCHLRGALCETDSPDTGEVARSARRGTLAPKVTEGWLAATILQHPTTPHRLPAELPSRGATLYPHRV